MLTCTNNFNVALGSNALFINTSSIDLVLLSTGQTRYLAGGAAGVTGPPAALCILSYGHVGD